LQRHALASQLLVDHVAIQLDPLRRRWRRSRRQDAPLKLILFPGLGPSPIEACLGGELKVLRNRFEADAERALYLSVREVGCPLQAEHFLDSAHDRPVSRHRR
jgi:hypothetical protein